MLTCYPGDLIQISHNRGKNIFLTPACCKLFMCILNLSLYNHFKLVQNHLKVVVKRRKYS